MLSCNWNSSKKRRRHTFRVLCKSHHFISHFCYNKVDLNYNISYEFSYYYCSYYLYLHILENQYFWLTLLFWQIRTYLPTSGNNIVYSPYFLQSIPIIFKLFPLLFSYEYSHIALVFINSTKIDT